MQRHYGRDQKADTHCLLQDPYYGSRDVATLCQDFIEALFSGAIHPLSLAGSTPGLAGFVAHAIYQTQAPSSVVFHALFLLSCFKAAFSKGHASFSSGHHLFISAFMIASKVARDDLYSNKSWSIAAQEVFTLTEINQMEREMCDGLQWRVSVGMKELGEFEAFVRRNFLSKGS